MKNLFLSNGKTSYKLETSKEYIIGRNPETTQICIDHISLSRNHAKLIVTSSGSISIQDLNSKNGTFVDNKKISINQLIILKPGTLLKFGENPVSFEIKESKLEEKEDRFKKSKEEKLEKKDKEIKNNKKEIRERSRSRSISKEKEKNKVNTNENLKDNEHKKQYNNFSNQNKEKEKEEKKNSVASKRTLLWGNKTQKETPKNLTSISIQSLDANDEEKIKFLKLMGVKNSEKVINEKNENEILKKNINALQNKNEHMQEDLEKQFNTGLQRKDGRKMGLGYY